MVIFDRASDVRNLFSGKWATRIYRIGCLQRAGNDSKKGHRPLTNGAGLRSGRRNGVVFVVHAPGRVS
jgi:hypothetical protein